MIIYSIARRVEWGRDGGIPLPLLIHYKVFCALLQEAGYRETATPPFCLRFFSALAEPHGRLRFWSKAMFS